MLLLDLVVMRGAHHHAGRAPCVRASFGGQWVRSPRLTMQLTVGRAAVVGARSLDRSREELYFPARAAAWTEF